MITFLQQHFAEAGPAADIPAALRSSALAKQVKSAATMDAVLTHRIDMLRPRVQLTLKVASVMGLKVPVLNHMPCPALHVYVLVPVLGWWRRRVHQPAVMDGGGAKLVQVQVHEVVWSLHMFSIACGPSPYGILQNRRLGLLLGHHSHPAGRPRLDFEPGCCCRSTLRVLHHTTQQHPAKGSGAVEQTIRADLRFIRQARCPAISMHPNHPPSKPSSNLVC